LPENTVDTTTTDIMVYLPHVYTMQNYTDNNVQAPRRFTFRKRSEEANQPSRIESVSPGRRANIEPSTDSADTISSKFRRASKAPFKDPFKDPFPHDDEVETGHPGLKVVYTPDNGHKVDIVFVHGLGGNGKSTWTKSQRPELFWPLTFLPLEPDLCLTRILTFGYDAVLKEDTNISVSVSAAAKALLFDLKHAIDGFNGVARIGDVRSHILPTGQLWFAN
jgi:hypothetical protein